MEDKKVYEAALDYAKYYCKSTGKNKQRDIMDIYFAFMAGANYITDNHINK